MVFEMAWIDSNDFLSLDRTSKSIGVIVAVLTTVAQLELSANCKLSSSKVIGIVVISVEVFLLCCYCYCYFQCSCSPIIRLDCSEM